MALSLKGISVTGGLVLVLVVCAIDTLWGTWEGGYGSIMRSLMYSGGCNETTDDLRKSDWG